MSEKKKKQRTLEQFDFVVGGWTAVDRPELGPGVVQFLPKPATVTVTKKLRWIRIREAQALIRDELGWAPQRRQLLQYAREGRIRMKQPLGPNTLVWLCREDIEAGLEEA